MNLSDLFKSKPSSPYYSKDKEGNASLRYPAERGGETFSEMLMRRGESVTGRGKAKVKPLKDYKPYIKEERPEYD